jgi:glycosyltransferase involved in cell wall biosynthesis
MGDNCELQVLLPVHNEAESITATIEDIYNEISGKVNMQFIICEDGSRDNTREILTGLSRQYPMTLIMSKERKGYSKAVQDGMLAMNAPFLLCLDSDGQCDPKDFWKFWELRDKFDVLVGWRVRRADTVIRKALSRFFYMFYKMLFHAPIHDPSCPFLLAKKDMILRLAPELGLMKQGFWWEFTARAYRRGYTMQEIPVNHKLRSAGTTQVYKFRKMPGIFMHHFIALFSIWRQTRK